jgi:hypothetical protein
MNRKIYKSYDGRWNHTERRIKVTFSEFLADRLNAIPVPYGSFEAARLFGSPVSMERLDLRAQVRGDAKKLASKTAKFLTMHAEYAARRSFDKRRNIIEPFVLPNPITRQSPCKPFESGKNTLDYYIPSQQTEYRMAA